MKRKYPDTPLVGVGALIRYQDEVVLVKRGNEPAKGLWSVPGGVLELGETLHDAVKREVREETGLEVEVDRLIDVVDNIVYDNQGRVSYHYVLIDYLCHALSEQLRASADVEEVRWIQLDDLHTLPTTKTLNRVLSKICPHVMSKNEERKSFSRHNSLDSGNKL